MNQFQSLAIDDDDDNHDNHDNHDDDDHIVDKIAILLGKQTSSSIPWQLMIGSYERNEKTYDNVNEYTNNVLWLPSGYLSLLHVNNFIAFNCYIDWINRINNNTVRDVCDITCHTSGTKFNAYTTTTNSTSNTNTLFKKKIFRQLVFSSDESILIGSPEVGVTVTVEQLLSAALHTNLISIIDDDNDNTTKIDIILPTPVSIKCRHIVADAFDTARRLLPSSISSKVVLNSVRSTAVALAISFIQTVKARKLLSARNGKIRICVVEIGEEFICTSFVCLESISSIVVSEKSNISTNNTPTNTILTPSAQSSRKKKKKKKTNASVTPIKVVDTIHETPIQKTPINNAEGSTTKDNTIIPAVVRVESSSGTCTFGLRDADVQLIQLWFLEIFKLIDHNDDNNQLALTLWNRLDSSTQDTCLNALADFRIMKVENLKVAVPAKSSKSSVSSTTQSKYHPSFIKLCDRLLNSVFYSSCTVTPNTKLPYPMIITTDDARRALEIAFLYYGGKIEPLDKTSNGNRFEINGNKFEIGSLNTLLRKSIKSAIKGQQIHEPVDFNQKGELIETPIDIDTVISWQEGHGSAYNIVTDHYNVHSGCIIDNVIRNILSEELSGHVRNDPSNDTNIPTKGNDWSEIVVDAFASGLQMATGLVPATNKKTSNKEIAEKLIQSMTCHNDAAELPMSLRTQWFELSASLVWEGLARLQIMDSVYSTQNPCIRVFEALPFPLGVFLRVPNTNITYQSNIVWLLDVDTMNRRKNKNLQALDSIREDTQFYLLSNSAHIGIYQMKRNCYNPADSQIQQDELFLIGNLILPSILATKQIQLAFIQLSDVGIGNEKEKVPSSKICTFDIIVDVPYYLAIQRFGGLNSFSLQKAVDSNQNTVRYLSPKPIRTSGDRKSTNSIEVNRSLMTKVTLSIIIVAVLIHTIATYIAATSSSLM